MKQFLGPLALSDVAFSKPLVRPSDNRHIPDIPRDIKEGQSERYLCFNGHNKLVNVPSVSSHLPVPSQADHSVFPVREAGPRNERDQPQVPSSVSINRERE